MDVDAQRELFRALTARRAGQLVHVDLAECDLTGAQAIGADLVGAELARATLAHASLAGARLARANLEGADLTGCDLGGADLTEANLRYADLSGARLDDAVLAGADLRDSCLRGIEGDPLSMSGALLNKGTIVRSELKMRDIARLVVRGALVNEKESLPPRGARSPRASAAPASLAQAQPVSIRFDSGEPASLPIGSLAIPAPDVLLSPLPEEFSPPSSLQGSIVPSLREREIEARHRLADLDDEVPASLRFMQRMNALIVEARPSLVPRSSMRPSASLRVEPLPAAMPQPGDEFLGAVLGEVLPGSTVSRTFRGTMADGVRVLVKVFDPGADGADLQLPAFQRGVRAMCRTHGLMQGSHPVHVAELFAVATDLTAYAVRDYENGAITNLVDVAITMQAGLEMFRSICETVAALHREGILVRSFKPNNILIDGLTPVIGEIDMIDLPALAEIRSDVGGYGSYVAPEELVGQGTRSPTSDIYALGKLVDYLLTGHEPILPVGAAPLVAERKGTPGVLVDIVKRCLAKDPADRYQYVDDLLEDLQSFEAKGATATLQASIRPGALSRLKTRPSLVPPMPLRKSATNVLAAPQKESIPPEAPPLVSPMFQRGLGALGLVLGALGLTIFYVSPGKVEDMEVAQIALSIVLGLGIWIFPAPKSRGWLMRFGLWAAAAAVVFLARPIQVCQLRWEKDLASKSLPIKEAAVERLSRMGRRDFSRADLRDARLGNVDLGGARFKGANLVRSDFRRAFLAEADFTGAELTEAKLEAADLRGARLEAARGLGKASCDANTRFPSWLRCKDGRPRMQGPRPTPGAPGG